MADFVEKTIPIVEAVIRARAAERERCAAIAEQFVRSCGSINGQEAAKEIAARIRQSSH